MEIESERMRIRPFHPQDQTAVKTLILAGLVEHWGTLDPTLNPDLNDIARSYANSTFLVVILNEEIVATGALILEETEGISTGRIVRMSTNKRHRRQGVGYKLLDALCKAAKDTGYELIVCETTSTWQNVITFYLNYGFEIIGEWGGDTHFQLYI